MTKRIMRALKLNEISGVTRPAQEHARAVIMKVAPDLTGYTSVEKGDLSDEVIAYLKRDFSDKKRKALAASGAALPDGSFPIENSKDLENAIHAVGRASDPAKAKAHIISRAKSLGATDELPDDWKPSGDAKKAERIDLLAKAFYASSTQPIDGAPVQGAQTFNAVLQQTQECQARSEVDSKMWPLYDALRTSITSIIQDPSMADVDSKMMAIRTSVEQFMSAAAQEVPEAEAELEKLLKLDPAAAEVLKAGDHPGSNLSNDGGNLMDPKQEIAALKTQLADLTKKLEEALKAGETANKASTAKITELETALKAAKKKPAAAADAEDDMDDGADEADEATKVAKKAKFDAAVKKATEAEVKKQLEAAATDEVIKIADPSDATKTIDIRKSAVGDQTFAMFKSQQAALKAASDQAELSVFAKTADTDYGKLPGQSTAKAKVLKHMAGMPEDVRKDLETMLKAGNVALKSGMAPLGQDGAGAGDGNAGAQLESLVDKYAAEAKVSKHVAYNEVLKTDDGKRLYRESLTKAA